MTEQNPFDKRHVEEVTPSQKTLLDELNLPPKLRSFLEQNGNQIKAGLLIILVLVAAWSFYDYYTARQQEQANALLFRAVNQGDPSSRQQLREKVQQEYPSTGAAVWSRVISAQRLMYVNNFDGAIKEYKTLIAEVGEDSPLYPLLKFGLAQACESSGQHDKALEHFTALQNKIGFTSVACFGLARNHEALGHTDKAREYYEKAGTAEGTPSSAQEYIAYKLSTV